MRFGAQKAQQMKEREEMRQRWTGGRQAGDEEVNPNLIAVGERVVFETPKKPKDPIPDVEWWDVALLASGTYDCLEGGTAGINVDKITHYVEHPVPIQPPAETPQPPPQPLKLTKKERKKLRTQRRVAREKEKQEMIRKGLMAPPKPKVKISNLMQVMQAEAVMDPTRIEAEVASQMAERQQAHEDRNLARKLTPAERKEKKERKLFRTVNEKDKHAAVFRVTEKGKHAVVFCVDDLSHPKNRFKVDINAQQNHLTGCVVICDELSVVVVEGVPKAIRRFTGLMLRRIDWSANLDDEEEEVAGGHKQNKCYLVWEGSVLSPAFDKFEFETCRSEAAARKYLDDKKVAHYFDLAKKYDPNNF
eukprot:jgi/Mesvir1/9820/Mv02981-RA.1